MGCFYIRRSFKAARPKAVDLRAGFETLNIVDLTATGTRVSLVPQFDFEGSKTSGNISGTLNGGGSSITLRCGFVNVTINHEQ